MLRTLYRFWFPQTHLRELGRQTFRRHLVAAFFEGMSYGIGGLAGYLLRKQLDATDFQVTLLFVLPMTIFVFSSLGAKYITIRNHRKAIFLIGFIGRLAIGLVLFSQHIYFIIGIWVWANLAHALFLPAQNIIFRSNYIKENRGLCYARAASVALIAGAMTAEIAGRLLEWRVELYPYLFGYAALCSFTAYCIYTTMPRDHKRELEVMTLEMKTKKPRFGEFIKILKEDVLYRKYELNFFIYGCGFMTAIPMVPLFVNDVLQADWTQASKVFGVIHPIVMLVFLPLYGRLLDRTHAIPVASLAFLVIAFWPLTLSLAHSMPVAYIAYLFFGMGMAGIDMAWMLGAISFAREERIQAYMAVHVSLVGIRAAIAPFIGLLVKRYLGFQATFLLSTTFFLTASALMFALYRKNVKIPVDQVEELEAATQVSGVR